MEDDENDEIETTKIQFRFRRFCAPAERIYANRHVFRLNVPPSPIQCWLPSWTPQLVRSWLERLLPEWFLPTSVILKERNPEQANNYENEIDTYLHLRALQGTYIPHFYSEVTVRYPHAQRRYQMSNRPTPAILLEYVEGVSLHHLPTEGLGSPRLLEELQGIYSLLSEEGVVHGDPRLHNFLRVGNGIIAIDFELSYPFPSDISNEDGLEALKIEIERRKGGAELAPLGSNVFFIDGSQVREGLGTDLRSSGKTTRAEQIGDEEPVNSAGSAT
ncbi:hypothetical protein BT67DRAFT_263987 [Trichocladium antarcticum]|uniref:Uncharacterized protein n=1 Tax=Trichocladium antarcticum TaxID=1450529 RepID=A0AAN6ZFF0_9PEZI|nr:hypothetical protein BT67DRAFT_263987 [Trichocladium antarcticum]